jgi:hypothetical protein
MLELPKLTESEILRVYTFPGGHTVEIANVTHLLVRASGTHRLRTEDGRLHIVPIGWIHIEIEAKGFSL